MGNAGGGGGGGASLSLPEKAIVRIASYLSVKDIIRVSQTSHLMNAIGADNKIWRSKCLKSGWGGRVTSTHAVRKKWKEVFIQYHMLAKQRRLHGERGKAAIVRGPKKIHVLLVGLDRSGKTTFLYRLKLGRMIVSIPTVGANKELVTRTVMSRGVQVERNFKFIDVGGIAPMRHLWHEYVKDESKIDILAFVVDASDPSRIAQAQAELQRAVQLVGGNKPVIVLANKFDVHRAMSAYQLCKMMKLSSTLGAAVAPAAAAAADKKKAAPLWCCQSISTSTGMGIPEALDWMVWACAPPTDTECWFCRDQDVDENTLQACSTCKHVHCADCVTRERSNSPLLCKFCFYCSRV